MIEPTMMRRAFGSEEGGQNLEREMTKPFRMWRTPTLQRKRPMTEDARKCIENDRARYEAARPPKRR